MNGDTDSGLVLLARADRLLAQVQNLDEATDLISKAQAAQVYARKAKLGLEAQNKAAEIKIRAERLAGDYIRSLERGQGSRQDLTSCNVARSSPYQEALESAGATRRDAMRWQLIAELPSEEFETEIAATKEGGRELTTSRMVKAASGYRSRQTVEEAEGDVAGESLNGVYRGASGLKKLQESSVKYRTLYLDPPWSYDNQGTRAATGNHYHTMSVEEIRALPVGELAADQAHLHLWTTNAFLFECPGLLDAWEFDYKGVFLWVKPHYGIGNYWRVAHEILVLGVRGNLPFLDRGQRSWQEFPRQEHSRKPEDIREILEKVSPGPRLEFFAREGAESWVCWGDQIRCR